MRQRRSGPRRSVPSGEIPEHIHSRQEERFTILAGHAHFTLNGEKHVARPGQTIVVPAGVPHSVANPGPAQIDGIVYAALTAADVRVLAARARWQRAAGLRVERLAHPRRHVPALGPQVRMALHFPDDHRVNNERLATALVVAARRAGVAVLERTPVAAVRARRGKVTGVDTGAGPVDAPVVVNAAGAWAGRLGLPPGVAPPPVFPVRGQIIVLRGGLEVVPRPLYSLRGYVVPRVDGRVLAGSTLEDAGYEKRVTAGAAADILAAACAMVPRLAGLTLDTAYAGLRPATPDHRPIIGAAPDLDGLVHATGHYRSGILLAPITAEAIADVVMDGRTALPVAAMRPGRFARRRRR